MRTVRNEGCILAHFVGKKNGQNRRTVGAASGRIEKRGEHPARYAARATTGAASAAGPGTTHLHAADRRTLHRPGLLMPCQVVFEMGAFEKRCSARRRLENPRRRRRRPCRHHDGRIGQRRSVVEHRRGCFATRAGRRQRQNPQQSIGRNAACIDRNRSSVSRQRWYGASRAGTEHNSRSDGVRLWNRPYTLWRADRPAICGRNAVVH